MNTFVRVILALLVWGVGFGGFAPAKAQGVTPRCALVLHGLGGKGDHMASLGVALTTDLSMVAVMPTYPTDGRIEDTLAYVQALYLDMLVRENCTPSETLVTGISLGGALALMLPHVLPPELRPGFVVPINPTIYWNEPGEKSLLIKTPLGELVRGDNPVYKAILLWRALSHTQDEVLMLEYASNLAQVRGESGKAKVLLVCGEEDELEPWAVCAGYETATQGKSLPVPGMGHTPDEKKGEWVKVATAITKWLQAPATLASLD